MTISAVSESSQIARWVINEVDISLFRNHDQLQFSVTNNKKKIQQGQISLNLYSMSYAISLVRIFHEAIKLNLTNALAKGEINSSCFLPVLCADVVGMVIDEKGEKFYRMVPNSLPTGRKYVPPNCRAALFGRVDRVCINSQYVKQVSEVRWALFDQTQTGEKIIFEGEDTLPERTKEFLLNAPRYDKPHPNEERNYEMTSYASQFRVVWTIDIAAKKHLIVLSLASKLDRDVLLDNDRWAVTIIIIGSGPSCSSNDCSNLPHAALAIEGVWKHNYVLHIADLTKKGVKLRQSKEHPFLSESGYEKKNSYSSQSIQGKGLTFRISAEKAKHLLSEILESAKFIKFNIAGNAMLSGNLLGGMYFTNSSCITWSTRRITKLLGFHEMYLYVLPEKNPNLNALTRSFRNMFVKKPEDYTSPCNLLIKHKWDVFHIPIDSTDVSFLNRAKNGLKEYFNPLTL